MLRRALHAAADSIEPDADGLNRIRSRLKTPRSVLVACAMAMWARLAMRIPDAAWTAGAKLTRERHHIAGGLATTRSPNSSRPERPRSWHRPAAALATAAFVVAFGVWAAMSVPAMTRPGGSLSAATGNGSGGGGGANTAGTEGHGSKARRSSPEPGRTTSAAACPTRSPAGGGPRRRAVIIVLAVIDAEPDRKPDSDTHGKQHTQPHAYPDALRQHDPDSGAEPFLATGCLHQQQPFRQSHADRQKVAVGETGHRGLCFAMPHRARLSTPPDRSASTAGQSLSRNRPEGA